MVHNEKKNLIPLAKYLLNFCKKYSIKIPGSMYKNNI